MDRDYNLLFGIFAAQLGKVSPAQLIAAAGGVGRGPFQGPL
jgi:hypothetical protein